MPKRRHRQRQPPHGLRNLPYSYSLVHVAFVVFVSLLHSFAADASFVLNVPALDEVCFVIRTVKGPESSLVTGSFDLLDDDLPPDPILVEIHDESMHRHYSSTPRTKSESFSVVVTGRVYLCVYSGHDHESEHPRDHSMRQVGLHVQVKTLDKTSGVMECVQRIQAGLGNFRAFHDYLRTREEIHRELVEHIFTKLLVWSLIEAGCVLLASVVQIMYLKRFIEKRRAF